MPEYFYDSIFYFVKHHSDEELENYGYQFIEKLYFHNATKKQFSKLMWLIDSLECPCEDIIEYYNYIQSYKEDSRILSDRQFFIIFKSLNYNIENTLHIIKLIDENDHIDEYISLLSYASVKRKNLEISFYDYHQFIMYYLNTYYSEIKNCSIYERYTLLYEMGNSIHNFLQYNISYDLTVKNNFNLDTILKNRFESLLPNTNNYLQTLISDKHNNYEYIYDPNHGFEEAKKLLEIGNINYRGSLETPVTKVIISNKDNCLKIKLKHFKGIYFAKYISNNHIDLVTSPNYQMLQNEKEFFIFYDKQPTFYEKRNNRFFPLSLKKLIEIKNICPIAEYLMKDLAENESKIFLDILRNPMSKEHYQTPIIINDLIGKQNLNHYFSKYKNGHYFNWNKGYYQQYYIIMKSLSYIKKEDWPKIIAAKDHLDKYNFKTIDSFIKSFIIGNLNDFNIYDDHENQILHDYIEMCKLNKNKINITIKSFKKLKRTHDLEMSQINISRNTLKVPKNSVYKDLRKILPKEFEWIKNKNRLIQEGRTQKHCVASYANKITQDKCAIYSFIYNDIRYTIEFIYKQKDSTYIINQCQSKFCHMHSKNFDWTIIDYIKGFSNKIIIH